MNLNKILYLVLLLFNYISLFFYVCYRKIIPLLENQTHYLNTIFENLIYMPKKFHSKPLLNELIEKLKITNSTYSDQLLGKYYWRVERVTILIYYKYNIQYSKNKQYKCVHYLIIF